MVRDTSVERVTDADEIYRGTPAPSAKSSVKGEMALHPIRGWL